MPSLSGELVTKTFAFDGGREVTAYVPPRGPDTLVYVADGGWHTERLAAALEGSVKWPSTMLVGVHGLDDDNDRLHEYVASSGGQRFEAFEHFFVREVRSWVLSELALGVAVDRTAVWGASLGGEFALATGLRHPDLFGAVFCVSPGGGFTPNGIELSEAPRTYLVGGTQEQWFFENAMTWADALRSAGVDVVIERRDGQHGDAFWYDEFLGMISWAFER